MASDAASAWLQHIAISYVIVSSFTLVFGTAPEMASTSLLVARIKAMLGVIVHTVEYLCLKNTVLQTRVLFVDGMYTL